MPRDLEPSLNEKAFIGQALQDGLRLDGRGLEDYRPISLSLGDEYGIADVRLGKTRYDSYNVCFNACFESAKSTKYVVEFLPKPQPK